MTKKGHQKFCQIKIEIFREKVKFRKFLTESEKFLGNRWGDLKQRANASLPQGNGRPCIQYALC